MGSITSSELLAASVNRIGMEGSLGTYQRFALTTAEGVANTPHGILAAAAYNLEHPMEMVKTVAGSAILAAGLKTVLPEAGPVGKIAGTIMGAYFVYSAAPEFLEAYKMGQRACTWEEMHASGARWGHAAGHLATNTVLGAAGYKIGAGLSGRILLSERMDGFADFKQNLWDSALSRTRSVFRMPEPIEPLGSLSWRPNYKIDGDRAILTDTTPQTNAAGSRMPVNPDAQLSSMVMVHGKASALRMERYITRMAQGRSQVLTDEGNAFQERFGAREESLAALKSFAERFKLQILESDARSGRVILNGKASDLQQAFGVKLESVSTGSGTYIDHKGAISVPKELAPHVRAVFGMDEIPIARPAAMVQMTPRPDETVRLQQQETGTGTNPSKVDPANFVKQGGYTAAEIARAQNFPTGTGGEGQHGAFISLGGGIDMADYSRFFSNRGLPQPKPLRIVEVGRGKNNPGNIAAGDVENALDGLIMQTIAPRANVSMIIASNDARGFVESFERGIFPRHGETQNSVLSSSWGLWEHSQLKPVTTSLSILIKQGTIRGMQIFAAAGDNGAGNSILKFGYQPEYPAADPHVTAVGGLKTIVGEDGRFSYVTAWNEGLHSATGGGVSTIFGRPWWQRDANVPKHLTTGRTGRGVPDISTNSAKSTGYAVQVGGNEIVIGGTSAGAPLYAGLMLNINAELALSGIKPVAPLNPWLYARPSSGIFNEVTTGNNNGYETAPGWNPVTGFGWVDGKAMLEAMKLGK